jgi:hypothetical protein
VYAGFSEYTDVQVGRIIEYLEQTKQLDNTVIFYCADNGASGEGTPNGSVNENKFFNGYPDDLEENLKHLDDLGSPDTYNHYPTGWATAFSTPFQMFKRYSQYAGGTCATTSAARRASCSGGRRRERRLELRDAVRAGAAGRPAGHRREDRDRALGPHRTPV